MGIWRRLWNAGAGQAMDSFACVHCEFCVIKLLTRQVTELLRVTSTGTLFYESLWVVRLSFQAPLPEFDESWEPQKDTSYTRIEKAAGECEGWVDGRSGAIGAKEMHGKATEFWLVLICDWPCDAISAQALDPRTGWIFLGLLTAWETDFFRQIWDNLQ